MIGTNLEGPWGVYYPGGEEWFIQTDDGLLFAQVFSTDLTVVEIEETAALFANARETKAQRDELLAALSAIVRLADDRKIGCASLKIAREMRPTFDAAHEAIAKAQEQS
tara:strand:+ start:967 stop:1293 length:327 start_codon:yes stop_codon:yes gene_type:complete